MAAAHAIARRGSRRTPHTNGAEAITASAPFCFLKGGEMRTSRREFLSASAAAVLASGLPLGWAGGVYASDAPESPKVRIGIIALTDCSTIGMAHELGLFKKHGI